MPGGRIVRINRFIRLEAQLNDEQQQRLLEIADRCLLHLTLENGPIEVNQLETLG